MIKNESASYLYHLIPKPSTSYFTRNSKILSPITANKSFFKNSFFSIHHHRIKEVLNSYIRVFALLVLANFSENETYNL